MSIYVELLLVAVIVIYIVGLSGFTDSWLGWISKYMARHRYPPVRELKPFSCSQCMVWWCCLIWCLIRKEFTLPTVAVSAGYAFLSMTMEQILIFIRETLLWLLKMIWEKED